MRWRKSITSVRLLDAGRLKLTLFVRPHLDGGRNVQAGSSRLRDRVSHPTLESSNTTSDSPGSHRIVPHYVATRLKSTKVWISIEKSLLSNDLNLILTLLGPCLSRASQRIAPRESLSVVLLSKIVVRIQILSGIRLTWRSSRIREGRGRG